MNKRRREARLVEHADTYKRKVQRTQLEDLSNELLYEIFEYCDFCPTHEAFVSLNSRFQSLFLRSSLPLKINFPLTSKSAFQRRCEQLVRPNAARVISLNINKHFLTFVSMDLFTSLRSLIVHQIPPESIATLLSSLIISPHLSALSIESSDYFQDENSIYLAIFRLTKLKSCKLTFRRGGERVPLPSTVSPCQTLERFVIDGYCRLDQLTAILSYLPRLQHLSCRWVYGAHSREMKAPIDLTSIALNIHMMPFDDLKAFLASVGRQLKILRIQTSDNDFVDAERWEQLIECSMPCLHTFDLQHTALANTSSEYSLIDQFSGKFWVDRKWFFDCYYHFEDEDTYYLHFFSIVPYKYHRFTLYEHIHGNAPISYEQHHTNFARHVTIEGCLRAKKYAMQFPKVIQLTLIGGDVPEQPWRTLNHASIVPLSKIQKLSISKSNFSGKKLVTLLRYLPNLQSLTLERLPSLRSKRRESTVSGSMNSRITRMRIVERCQLEYVEFCLRAFPCVEQLGISIDENHLTEILRVLLSKATHLFSLVLSQVNYDIEERVQSILATERIVCDYSMERIRGELYLWW